MKNSFTKRLPLAALSMAALLFSSSSASAYAIQKNFTYRDANCVAEVSYALTWTLTDTAVYVHIVETINGGPDYPNSPGDELLYNKTTIPSSPASDAEIEAVVRDAVRKASANPLCNGELDGSLATAPTDWPQ